jgi:glycosyltransferase involved in cell wall biosynthesis
MAEITRRGVSIVIPAYAEEQRIGRAVRELRRLAAEFPRLGEVLVVVEPSADRTVEAARAAAAGDPLFTIVENPDHRGKGFSVRTGMLRAAGNIVFFMDADLSVPLAHVAPVTGVIRAVSSRAVSILCASGPDGYSTTRCAPSD